MSRQTDVTPANCYLDATATICTRLLWFNFEHVWVTNTYKMNHHMHREMVDVSYIYVSPLDSYVWHRDMCDSVTCVTAWHVWHVTLDVKWSIIVKELSQKLPLDDSYEGFSFTRSRPLDLDWSDEDRRSRMTMDPTDEMKTHDEIGNIWMMRSWRDMIGHIRSKM